VITLTPYREAWPSYGATVREFAGGMAAAGRGDRLERGLSKGMALLAPIALTPVALGAAAVSLFALENEPWWGRLIVPAIPIAILALTLWLGLTRIWPRPVRTLADLHGQVPP
jgi:peptidoglycan/LPS O-acetylase OafA/YrhL